MSSASVEEKETKPECVPEPERDLAQSALHEFQAQHYNGCLQYLAKLDNKKEDFKVLHNRHVAEYYKGELKKTSAFSKNLNGLLQQFGLQIDKLDDVEYCVAYFNIGILLYQQRQYTKSLKIIEGIYKFIEPLDESLGRQVGLLLIDLHLSLRQVDKALSLVTYFHNQMLNQAAAQKSEKSASKWADKRLKSNEEFLRWLERYRIRCNLLSHSLKSASVEIKALHDSDSGDVEVLYFLANQQYLEGRFQDAMKTLGRVPAGALDYVASGDSSNVLFYNNIGVIHHAMGKPNLACHYFRQAIYEEQALSKHSKEDLPLHVLGASRHHELMFNLGLALLYAGKSSMAFECLIVAVRKFHRNCRLWLRLAECCIQEHKPTNRTDFEVHRKQKELVVDVLGSRETQKVILNTNLTKDKKYSSESQSYAIPVANLEFATLCLKNAAFLLESDVMNVNAACAPLLLIPGVSVSTSSSTSTSLPSSVFLPDDKTNLKNSILVAHAYCSLCLGDYVVALSKARELLAQPKISGCHKLLGNLYAAECLVLQDKLNEALDHLNPENIKDIGLECVSDELDDDLPTKTNPPATWFPNNLQSAISVMQYNVAIIKTIRGQYDQAAALLNQVWQSQNSECMVPAQIVMLVLYIKIQLGHIDVAKNFIRQYSIQRRISG